MEDERIIYLYQSFISRQATPEELNEFQHYLSSAEAERYLIALLEKEYPGEENLSAEIDPLIGERIFNFVTAQAQEKTKQAKTRKLWPRRFAVAAAMATLLTGVYFFSYQAKEKSGQELSGGNHIAPGKVGATLTLASGKRIRLADLGKGLLARESGVSISKTAHGEIIYEVIADHGGSEQTNSLSTANGEVYSLVLPDKSKVYLNAASSITYPTSFSAHDERRIKLSGEAYFEVAKDKAHPFIVETDDQKLTVLGTHFNVSSYPDESSTRTTLLEGAVHIGHTPDRPNAGVQIRPGQQATMSNGKISVNEVFAQDAIAWKEGYFRFNNETMEDALKKIARWYDVRIVYKDQELKQQNVYGSLSRFSSISQVLKLLELTDAVKFKVEGKEITAFKK